VDPDNTSDDAVSPDDSLEGDRARRSRPVAPILSHGQGAAIFDDDDDDEADDVIVGDVTGEDVASPREVLEADAIDDEFDDASEPFDVRDGWRSGLALAVFGGLTGAAAYLGRRATEPNLDPWYAALDKPSFTPPSWIFGPVWTGMYTLTAWSGWRVWQAPPSRTRTVALALWGAQLLLNAAWSPLFFGRHRPRSALVDLVALTAAVSAYAVTSARVDRTAAALVVPYLGWLGFATALNEGIVRRNPWVR
jgi:tryptophan-rich sensory protein